MGPHPHPYAIDVPSAGAADPAGAAATGVSVRAHGRLGTHLAGDAVRTPGRSYGRFDHFGESQHRSIDPSRTRSSTRSNFPRRLQLLSGNYVRTRGARDQDQCSRQTMTTVLCKQRRIPRLINASVLSLSDFTQRSLFDRYSVCRAGHPDGADLAGLQGGRGRSSSGRQGSRRCNISKSAAMEKSANTFAKQIEQMGTLIMANSEAVNDKFGDLKDRIDPPRTGRNRWNRSKKGPWKSGRYGWLSPVSWSRSLSSVSVS